jgi:hypothetical protein
LSEEQKVAYIQAMVACALIEMEGMKAENQHRLNCGESIAYGKEQFDGIIERLGIHHNGVLGLFQGR